MVTYEIFLTLAVLAYIAVGHVTSCLFKDPDTKAFTSIFWPLIYVYYMLFWMVSFIRRILVRLGDVIFGGNSQN